ncbi:MAG: hypothetical protein US40_C0016G0011 [Candidatus Roizmanbacteria bacterium GW2011_GWC2_37_13]|uniref:Transmembrane protein n=1 Tax=Candidatus Roizmanbacteria bacterium GW2011_GWC2_37_13 TaxID=1618486 RepID=A0A0G0IJQ9_9BACT|nr:MAG: hypothetical protein US38_C0017G0008 [Candidatus Roizmanbacteria bacterium GW2011_GWC1_37_12]KKQ24449.1 MAG: hypothetical protein US40_C0016G0011 [Candidatus Roizmanbacteria bacterium GW2011_GWC2_37_13]
MRKILFLIILLITFINPFVILAQTPTPFNTNLTIPSYNCGFAEDPTKNQCCRVYYPSSFIPPDLGPLNSVVNFFSFFTSFARDSFLQPLFDLYGQIITDKSISSCYTGVQSVADPNNPSCKCINPISPSPGYQLSLNEFCQKQSKLDDRNTCLQCANSGGVWSGIGCVYTDTKSFIQKTVFGMGIGLAGGFALLCIIYAAFMMQSSQGNPEKLKKAQEMITSCIMGLMLIIFSVFILRLIGVNILKIPGFN